MVTHVMRRDAPSSEVGGVMASLMLSQRAAADYLGIAPRTLRAWTKAGKVPHWVDPDTGTVRYHRLALREWSRQNGREVAA